MLELKYKYYPLMKAVGCLAGFCLFAAWVWLLINNYDHQPRFIKLFLILSHPVPFVLMTYFLFKTSYFISIFSDRSIAQLKKNKRQLELSIAENRDFVLYLRNHSLEEGAVVEAFPRGMDNSYHLHSPGISRGTGISFYSIDKNLFEEDVIRPIIDYMPVFTLHSLRDDRKSVAKRVLTKESGWFNDVKILIDKAKYIIMNFEKPTKGMVLELSYIIQSGTNDKTLLITSPKGVESLNNCGINTERINLPVDFLQKIGIEKPDQIDH